MVGPSQRSGHRRQPGAGLQLADAIPGQRTIEFPYQLNSKGLILLM